MIDVAFIALGIALGFLCFYWARRIAPAPNIFCLLVYIFMSWLSFIIVILSIWFNWWDYTSPALKWGGSILLTSIFYYPPYAVAQALLLKGFWRNIFLIFAVTCLLSLNEYLIIKYGTFAQYHNWNHNLTFISYLVPYTLVCIFSIWLRNKLDN